METYIQQGKDFIENELHYSFNSMETKTVAKRLLMAFTKGFELAKSYWQKGMFTQEQIDEMLDHQVCMTTAQMLEKQSYTEKRLNEFIKLHFDGQKIYTESEKLESFDLGITVGSNEATNRLLTVMYTEEEVYELLTSFDSDSSVGYFNGRADVRKKWFEENKKNKDEKVIK